MKRKWKKNRPSDQFSAYCSYFFLHGIIIFWGQWCSWINILAFKNVVKEVKIVGWRLNGIWTFFCLISGITKATPLKQYPQEEPNRTDPNEVITNIKSGEIKTANLNNVPISEEKVLDLCQALRNNETLTVNNLQWIEFPVRFVWLY